MKIIFAIGILFGFGFSQISADLSNFKPKDAPPLPKFKTKDRDQMIPKTKFSLLKNIGISDLKIEELKQVGLYNKIEHSKVNCSHSRHTNIYAQFVSSDIVIIGTISNIEYLYKEGGAFRTVYEIQISSILKGNEQATIKVKSIFGPFTKDHRVWKENSHKIEFEKGDNGLFFVKLIKGTNTFLSTEAKSAYIIDNEDFDRNFLALSGKEQTNLSLNETIKDLKQISTILNEGE